MTEFLPVEIIKKTRNGIPLTESEIQAFIEGYTRNEIPDYQMSAWLMAVVLKGLTPQETLSLTKTMLYSGATIDLSSLVSKAKIDKHSTGGIGDKTSIILGPIVAACGVLVPMMSGRGLGHTGGTLDKLESIPGFNTQLSLNEFKAILRDHGVSFIGQTVDICPADKKIYALRDVTGTVESLELISASIMSKKLAEDINGLVLDVKFGSGAFMKNSDEAKRLALSLQHIGKGAEISVTAFLTNMNQPLGAFIGNALEIQECVDILSNKPLINKNGLDLYSDCRELSLVLSAQMLVEAGLFKNQIEARIEAEKALTSGAALKVFESVCMAQGGQMSLLPKAPFSLDVSSKSSGFIIHFEGEKIGMLGIKLGAGRSQITDKIDPTAGFQIHFKIGEFIQEGQTLWTIYGTNIEKMKSLEKELLNTVIISDTKPEPFVLIKEILN